MKQGYSGSGFDLYYWGRPSNGKWGFLRSRGLWMEEMSKSGGGNI